MTTIKDTITLTNEIVLTERCVTTEFVIQQIQEDIQNRKVRVEIELGPFTTELLLDGRKETRGSTGRSVTVWENDAYDAVRDTWRNTDLMSKVTEILNS